MKMKISIPPDPPEYSPLEECSACGGDDPDCSICYGTGVRNRKAERLEEAEEFDDRVREDLRDRAIEEEMILIKEKVNGKV
jgi:hypothetical protein